MKAKEGFFDDIVGEIHGRLTVLCPTKRKGKNNEMFYLCRCECGKEKEINRSNLRFNKTLSCGCLRADGIRKSGKLKKARRKEITCGTCGKHFKVPKCREDIAKYCSYHCHNESMKKTDYEFVPRDRFEHNIWKDKVKNRDNNRCINCGNPDNLHAHHLQSFHAYPDKRIEVDNGVTLCDDCHVDFHKQYGYHDFTQIDFIRWIK